MQKLQGCTSVKVFISLLLRLKLGDGLLWNCYCFVLKIQNFLRLQNDMYPNLIWRQRVIRRESKTDSYSKGPTLFGLRCILCCNFWTNYDLDLFITSKWPSDLQLGERYKVGVKKIAPSWSKNGLLSAASFVFEIIALNLRLCISFSVDILLDSLPAK